MESQISNFGRYIHNCAKQRGLNARVPTPCLAIPSAAIKGRRTAESRDIAPESATLAAEEIATDFSVSL